MESRDRHPYQEICNALAEQVILPSMNALRGIRRWGALTIGATVSLGIVVGCGGPEAPRVPTSSPIESGTSTPTTIVIDQTPTAIPLPTETPLPLLPPPSPSPSPRAERAPATPTLTTEAKEIRRRGDVAEMREMFSSYVQSAPNNAQVLAELNRIENLSPEDSKRVFTTVHTGYTNNRPGSFVQLILLNPSLQSSRTQSQDVMHLIKDLDPSGEVKTRIMKFSVGATGIEKIDNSPVNNNSCLSSPVECVIGPEVLHDFTKQNDSYIRAQEDKETIIRQVGTKILIIERYDRTAAISPGWL